MLKKFFISFVLTAIVLFSFLSAAAADSNSAYIGFGEQNFTFPTYNGESGHVSGRILGYDYGFYFFDEEQMQQITQSAKRLVLPFVP